MPRYTLEVLEDHFANYSFDATDDEEAKRIIENSDEWFSNLQEELGFCYEAEFSEMRRPYMLRREADILLDSNHFDPKIQEMFVSFCDSKIDPTYLPVPESKTSTGGPEIVVFTGTKFEPDTDDLNPCAKCNVPHIGTDGKIYRIPGWFISALIFEALAEKRCEGFADE